MMKDVHSPGRKPYHMTLERPHPTSVGWGRSRTALQNSSGRKKRALHSSEAPGTGENNGRVQKQPQNLSRRDIADDW